MMTINTHLAVNPDLCGRITELSAGRAVCRLTLTDCMRADTKGLVHGGFIFGAADYAAMVAVNEPHVVLSAAEVGFLVPSRVGDELTFEAVVRQSSGIRSEVEVTGRAASGEAVFKGRFACAVPPAHVLHRKSPGT